MKRTRRSVTVRRSRKTFLEKLEGHKICEIRNKREDIRCEVYHFECDKAEDNELVRRITKVAVKQRRYFYEIYPWKTRCKERWHMYIAMRKDDRTGEIVICAWCSVRNEELEKEDGERKKAGYIVEVSVRRKKEDGGVDEKYKGMGIELLRKIFEYSKERGVRMMYLVPSNEVVKGLYMSSLGMSEVEGTSYLVKSTSSSSSSSEDAESIETMREIIRVKRRKEIEKEEELYEEGLRELSERIRARFIEKVDERNMSLDDKTALLGEIAMMVDDTDEDEIIEYIDGI